MTIATNTSRRRDEAPATREHLRGLSRVVSLNRAARNMRRHWLRDAVRVTVLVGTDLSVFLVLRSALRAVRDGMLLGPGLSGVVTQLFPEGFLGGWRFAVALLISMLVVGAYGAGDRRRDAGLTAAGVAFAALLVLYGAAWQNPLLEVAVQFAATVAVFVPVLVGVRLVVDVAVRRLRPRIAPSRALLVAHASADWIDLADLLARPTEFALVGSLQVSDGTSEGVDEQLENLGALIEELRIDTVLMWGALADAEFAFVTDIALAGGCRLLAGPRTTKVAGVEPRAVWIHGRSLIELTAPSLQAWQFVLKRFLDLVGATVGLLLLSPLLALVAAMVRLDSRGPAIFAQNRLGARGREFHCYKFRSMRQDAELALRSDPTLYKTYLDNHFKLPEEIDPRLTRLGRFLRRTSLDELPQLVNVLLGHMSLVGPRPIVPDELQHYGGGAGLFLSLKPGITGAWAVAGRSKVGYPRRAHVELQYIRNWSLATDLLLLLRTVPAVVKRRGAH